MYEKEIGAQRGHISGNTDRLKEFTADCNQAFDDFWNIAVPASGTWQADDANHTKYAIVMKNIVANQRDYQVTADEQGNKILDIYNVSILQSATDTEYTEIDPFDELNERDNSIVTQNTSTGVPTRYGKLSNGIFFDILPSYSATNGLRAFVSREPFYFTYGNTTQKPGVPGTLHAWFYKKPALEHAKRNSLANAVSLSNDIFELTRTIKEVYGQRERDVRKVMTGKKINYI